MDYFLVAHYSILVSLSIPRLRIEVRSSEYRIPFFSVSVKYLDGVHYQKTSFRDAMSESVIGITYNDDRSKVLLIQRRDVMIWTLPGGGIESNERPEEAITREITEETGFTTTIERKTAVYSPINRLTTTTHVFECSIVDGSPTKGPETFDVAFFSIDSLPNSFFHIHHFWLTDALNHPEHMVEKPIDQVTYWAVMKYFFAHPIRLIRCIISRMGMPWNSKN